MEKWLDNPAKQPQAVCMAQFKTKSKLKNPLPEKLRHTPFAWISAIFPERAEASFVLDSLFLSH
jgi:hypothetical protein